MNGEESDNAPTPRFEAFWGLQAGGRAESGQDGGVAVARATLRIRLDGLSKELGLSATPGCSAAVRRFWRLAGHRRED